ncbi:hypothetical protein CFIMG_004920RA [Ceratocystis fimbriata CBS 114723]|uniref:Uncharacterized protein n=1 Tax=Ceratocystis fimbriata CBS 114723 TaxID=1035309 RepID=A0A2C5X1B5_9PEZI|nr:hypothetical protein CFIMG_004920RA [Ceratocystis fimbriata CBS 114723]
MPSSSSRSSRSSRSTRPSRSRFSFYNLSTETLASMVWLDPAPIPISEPLLEEPENQTPSEECQSAKDDDGSDPQTPPAEGSQNLIYYSLFELHVLDFHDHTFGEHISDTTACTDSASI